MSYWVTPEEIDEFYAKLNNQEEPSGLRDDFLRENQKKSDEMPSKIEPKSRILELERSSFGWGFSFLSVLMKDDDGIEFTCDELREEILFLESMGKGFVSFLLRNRCYLLFPLRSDLLKLKDWENTVSMLKKMGFPLYICTDDVDQYKKLALLLDRDRDIVFHFFNGDCKDGFNKAAKFLAENCSNYILQIRKWNEGELLFEDVREFIESVNPPCFSIFPSKFSMKIKDEELTKIRKYCIEKHISHDVFDRDFSKPYDEYNLTGRLNRKLNQNRWILLSDLYLYAYNYIIENGLEFVNIRFEDFLVFYKEQIQYLKQCVFRKEDMLVIDMTETGSDKEYFSIMEFLSLMWNNYNQLRLDFQWHNEKDKDGNVVYFVSREFSMSSKDFGPNAVNDKNTIFGDMYV